MGCKVCARVFISRKQLLKHVEKTGHSHSMASESKLTYLQPKAPFERVQPQLEELMLEDSQARRPRNVKGLKRQQLASRGIAKSRITKSKKEKRRDEVRQRPRTHSGTLYRYDTLQEEVGME
uniref:C2H2-type domain-containing protein n=1 Tax=Haptolina ericina TaxID=156174 RepID=A0A7S3BBC7_9EUKA